MDAAVRRSVDLLGGMSAFVRPGDRVLLKPNLLRPLPPERAATTHPAVVAAVAKLVAEAGGQPLILDSPGGPYTPGILRLLYRKTGMDDAAEESGADLNYNVETAQVSHLDGVVLHRLDIVKPLLDADVVINLPKLKTHNLTGMTLATKNLFGLVPGSLKIAYHAKLQEVDRFCEGLLDILTYARPTLHIMDAVVGMEGNGPSGGSPREVGAIVVGSDALAVDVLSSALAGMDSLDVLTTKAAVHRGLTTGRLDDLKVLGDPLDTLRVALQRGTAMAVDPGILPHAIMSLLEGKPTGRVSRMVGRLLKGASSGWWARQLVVLPQAGPCCTGCGYCVRHCPVDAIQIVDGRAQMDPARCIRCYCCHELCPELAVDLRRPWLGRLLVRG